MENSSRIFPEIFIFRGSTQAVLLEKSSIRFFFDWNHKWYVTFGLDEFPSKTVSEISRKFVNEG